MARQHRLCNQSYDSHCDYSMHCASSSWILLPSWCFYSYCRCDVKLWLCNYATASTFDEMQVADWNQTTSISGQVYYSAVTSAACLMKNPSLQREPLVCIIANMEICLSYPILYLSQYVLKEPMCWPCYNFSCLNMPMFTRFIISHYLLYSVRSAISKEWTLLPCIPPVPLTGDESMNFYIQMFSFGYSKFLIFWPISKESTWKRSVPVLRWKRQRLNKAYFWGII